MSIKAVLFDLDGTLLPMDQDVFIKRYLTSLAKSVSRYGYDPEQLTNAIWKGTEAMVKNDGSATNETVFWKCFCEAFGDRAMDDLIYFDEFYQNGFDEVREVLGYDPNALSAVELVKKKGLRPVLATNPVFPRIATEKRSSWAGTPLSLFELVTSYENSRFSKPNPKYYIDIADHLGLSPSECLMVGNDVSDDMVAESIGMKVFLLTDCLINKNGEDISAYPHGDFETLIEFIAQK